jgi:hypothetical protein
MINRRQDTTDKIKANVKPDSEKSTLEKGQEQLTGTADSLAGKAQPDDQKSYTQQATDTASSTAGDAQKQGSNLLNQASEGLSNTVKSVQDSLGMGGDSEYTISTILVKQLNATLT